MKELFWQSFFFAPFLIPITLGFSLTLFLVFLERLFILGIWNPLSTEKLKGQFFPLLQNKKIKEAQKLCLSYQKRGATLPLFELLMILEDQTLKQPLIQTRLNQAQLRYEKRISSLSFLGLIHLSLGSLFSLAAFLKIQFYQTISEDMWNWYLSQKLSTTLFPLLFAFLFSFISFLLEALLRQAKIKRSQELEDFFILATPILLNLTPTTQEITTYPQETIEETPEPLVKEEDIFDEEEIL